VQRLDRVGEIEETAGVYAETKIEELPERKLRFDHSELAQQWDKIQRRERGGVDSEDRTKSISRRDLVKSFVLSRTPENE
jgi:hypothetical protein